MTAPRPRSRSTATHPLNQTIPVSLRVDVTQAAAGRSAGVANEGFWGIPVKPEHTLPRLVLRQAAPGFAGPITPCDRKCRWQDDLCERQGERGDDGMEEVTS